MARDVHHFHPLSEFYVQQAQPLPATEPLPPEEIPEPYRGLLAHEIDMPRRLGEHYGQTIRLRVVRTHLDVEAYMRQVVLVREDEKPVQCGAIKIYLTRFSDEAQKLILEEKLLLDGIMRRFNILFVSKPEVFFRVSPDGVMKKLLDLADERELFGRRNVYLNTEQETYAEILEILAPTE